MRSGLFVQTLAEGLKIKVVQLEPVKAKRKEEGMEVVMPELVEVGIRTEMQVVCLQLGVLQVREGRLGVGYEEGEIPEGRGEERSAKS